MNRQRCDAVIVCHGGSPWLEACVNALVASPVCGMVLLVDHGRTAGVLQRVAQRHGPRVCVLGDGSNRGFGAGVNAGFAASDAEFLAAINPDCVLDPAALERVIQAFDAHPRTGLVGGMLTNPDGSEQAGARRAVPGVIDSMARVLGLHRLPIVGKALDFNQAGQPMPESSTPVPAVSGAFMVVRRSVLQAVGGFDERFFLHFEDLEWCARIRRAGFEIRFEPRARATHAKGVSSDDRPIFILYHKHRSWLLFQRLRRPGWKGWVVTVLAAMPVWMHFAVRAAICAVRRSRA